ncbi:MAG: mechanosensitive ion channel family protein [Myxococcota bacterium]
MLTRVFSKLSAWVDKAVDMMPNVAVAILVVTVAWFLARALERAVTQGLRHLSRGSGETQLPGLLGALVRVGAVASGVFFALSVLHLDKAVTSLLAGIGVIGLALGFAFQDIAANLISGVMLVLKKPFVAGDVIEYDRQSGKVLRVDLRDTRIQRFTGEIVIVPNRRLLEQELVNVSTAGSRRIDLAVGVCYDADLEQAQAAACRAVESLEHVLTTDGHTVEALFTGFGASSIDIQVRFWVDYADDPMAYVRVRSDAVKAIKREFDESGLQIPFPIRTLDVPARAIQALTSHAA